MEFFDWKISLLLQEFALRSCNGLQNNHRYVIFPQKTLSCAKIHFHEKYSNVNRHFDGCYVFQYCKDSKMKPSVNLQPLELLERRYSSIQIYFIVRFPATKSVNDTIERFFYCSAKALS